jgi:hypothetical protein
MDELHGSHKNYDTVVFKKSISHFNNLGVRILTYRQYMST